MFENITSGDPTILLGKASESKEKKDYTNYFIHLIMACNLNNKKAIGIFANICKNEFLQQDFTVTKHFYQETINFPYSMNRMGYLYEYGLGVTQDLKKSTELYQFGVDNGLVISMYNLALSYRDRILGFGEQNLQTYDRMGVKQNIEKSIQLFKMAVKMGHCSSMNSLGVTYETKIKNYDLAIKYYEMAANEKYEMATNNLADLYKKMKNLRDKKYVINYFFSIGKEEKLKFIYNYDDEDISLLKDRFEFSKENEKIKVENREMKNHILASPDGLLYFEALEEWKKRLC
jgi:TPR repeat protein